MMINGWRWVVKLSQIKFSEPNGVSRPFVQGLWFVTSSWAMIMHLKKFKLSGNDWRQEFVEMKKRNAKCFRDKRSSIGTIVVIRSQTDKRRPMCVNKAKISVKAIRRINGNLNNKNAYERSFVTNKLEEKSNFNSFNNFNFNGR